MNQSIFGSLALPRTSSLQRPRGRETSPAPAATKPSWSESTDVALIAIIEAPLRTDETIAQGFARKEAELCHALSKLSIIESRALHLRLVSPRSGDQLVAAFQRLTGERRERVTNFIADARRRAALARR